jgi:Transcriptional regulators
MDNEEIKMGALFRWINNTFEQRINEMLKKHDLTRSQCDILLYLTKSSHKGIDNITQRDIEKTFRISNPTVTGLLNRLESKEFIGRKVSSKDARYKYIVLSDKAIRVLNEIKLSLDENERKVFSCLSEDEVDTLKSILLKIVSDL